MLPRLAHAADERVRPAKQQDVRPQRVTAREHGQVLQDDRVEQRRHELVGRRAFFLQTIDVRLGEHTTLARHLVEFDAQVSLIAQLHGRDFEFGVDLVDHGAGAPGALVVHRRDLLFPAGLRIRFEDDDLGVLTAQLDHRVHFRMHFFDCQRDGRDLLDELRAHQRGEIAAARSGDEHPAVARPDLEIRFEPAEKLKGLLRLLGFVTLVVRPDHPVGGWIHGDSLDRGRSDIDADEQLGGHRVTSGTPRGRHDHCRSACSSMHR